jgi:hypothetical protein
MRLHAIALSPTGGICCSVCGERPQDGNVLALLTWLELENCSGGEDRASEVRSLVPGEVEDGNDEDEPKVG